MGNVGFRITETNNKDVSFSDIFFLLYIYIYICINITSYECFKEFAFSAVNLSFVYLNRDLKLIILILRSLL